MTVPFHYYDKDRHRQRPEWTNFIKAVNAKVSLFPKQDEMIEALTTELNKYGATTNWSDQTDPIWFPDQESLTEFLLVWS